MHKLGREKSDRILISHFWLIYDFFISKDDINLQNFRDWGYQFKVRGFETNFRNLNKCINLEQKKVLKFLIVILKWSFAF